MKRRQFLEVFLSPKAKESQEKKSETKENINFLRTNRKNKNEKIERQSEGRGSRECEIEGAKTKNNEKGDRIKESERERDVTTKNRGFK